MINAKEGMWLPNLIQALNYSDMITYGIEISAEELYNANKSSIKDAVAHFNGGCSSAIISNNGLLITNHHCGYSYIASHSTVENNYLNNGFWAQKNSDELKCDGLFVDIIDRIEDVTSLISLDLDEKQIAERIKNINDSISNKNSLNSVIKPFNYGNKYFAFIFRRYEDIRMVGTPPSSIGKYGFDSDNWVWPRHTGDFSIFRIYADDNNSPAKYSEDNKPFEPKYFLKVANREVKENDFAMVYGFPGSTEMYLSSYEVNNLYNYYNVISVDMRELSLKNINELMKSSEQMNIKYASKQARISNYWKKRKGENFGIKKINVVSKKRESENLYIQQHSEDYQLIELMANIKKIAQESIEVKKAYSSYVELITSGPNSISNMINIYKLLLEFDKIKENNKRSEIIQKIQNNIESYKQLSNIEKQTDIQIWKDLLKYLIKNINKNYHPSFFQEKYGNVYQDNTDKIVDELFAKSAFFGNESQWIHNLNKSIIKEKYFTKIKKDYGYLFIKSLYDETLINKILKEKDKIEIEENNYQKIISGKYHDIYKKTELYDANGTLRISYGKVEGSEPEDGKLYKYYTTADGILEKYIPNSYEYDLDTNILCLLREKEYGDYQNKNGELVVCFTSSNHTTGGNSGSPVLNSKGELMGMNFDRSWESTMSDIYFSNELCRNIVVDSRYILFIIEKLGKCDRLIDEMQVMKD